MCGDDRRPVVPAALLMVEYVVHLEALKADRKGLPKPGTPKPWQLRLIGPNAAQVLRHSRDRRPAGVGYRAKEEAGAPNRRPPFIMALQRSRTATV